MPTRPGLAIPPSGPHLKRLLPATPCATAASEETNRSRHEKRNLRWVGSAAETLCCIGARSVVEVTREVTILAGKDKGKCTKERVLYVSSLEKKPDGAKAEAFERTVPMKGGDMVGGTDPDDAFLLIDFEKYASDVDGNRWSKGFRDSYVSPLGDSYSRTWVEEKRFAIIYVTDDGRILGIGPEHADSGKAVMLSCWSSVAEAAAKQVW